LVAGRIVESIKKPHERRVWFHYQGQGHAAFEGPTSLPSYVGRVHSDGTTQLSRYSYNAQGNLIQAIDPVGRVTTLEYAPNGIDLTSISTSGQTLMSATYDTHHNLLTLTNAAGGTSTFTYENRGLIESSTNSLGETTVFGYTQSGNLATIEEPLQKITTFSYDSAERLNSATDSEGYTVQVSHDALERPDSSNLPAPLSHLLTRAGNSRFLSRNNDYKTTMVTALRMPF